MDTLRRSGSVALALVAAAALAAPMQAATCGAGPATIAAADIVFVGTFTAANPGGEATFAVEDVWKGGDLGAVVEVTGAGGYLSGQAVGTRYLVLAKVVGSSLQVGSECNAPYPWDVSMAASRPATAHPPLSPSTGDGVPPPLILLAGIAAVVVVVSFIAFRPRRAPAG